MCSREVRALIAIMSRPGSAWPRNAYEEGLCTLQHVAHLTERRGSPFRVPMLGRSLRLECPQRSELRRKKLHLLQARRPLRQTSAVRSLARCAARRRIPWSVEPCSDRPKRTSRALRRRQARAESDADWIVRLADAMDVEAPAGTSSSPHQAGAS